MPAGRWQLSLQAFLRVCFGQIGWERGGGWQGYEFTARCGGVLVAWGGAAQAGTVHVEVPGAVCGACDGWISVVDHLRTLGARLTRVDVAGDDYQGELVSVDWAIDQYKAGAFRVQGRHPSVKLIDDFGTGKGRTFYVGRRENGKVLRVYEKGRQLGAVDSPWTRAEVEFRAKDRVLSFDMLLRPWEFLAGAFKPLAFFAAVRVSLRTVRERVRLSFARSVEIARLHAGRVVNSILVAFDGDVGRVVDLLRRDGFPRGLSMADLSAVST